MSSPEITSLVESIRALPEVERIEAATRLVRELTPDTLEAKVKNAVDAGHFAGLYGQAMLDYAQGRALDRLD